LPDALPVLSSPAAALSQDPAAVLIAVVIPAWRQPGLLPEALDSVLAQLALQLHGS
jgi:hypothetical protein